VYNNDAMNNQLKNFLRVLNALDKEQKDSLRYKDKFDAAYLKDFIDIRRKG
jgi:hypothetical protein